LRWLQLPALYRDCLIGPICPLLSSRMTLSPLPPYPHCPGSSSPTPSIRKDSDQDLFLIQRVNGPAVLSLYVKARLTHSYLRQFSWRTQLLPFHTWIVSSFRVNRTQLIFYLPHLNYPPDFFKVMFLFLVFRLRGTRNRHLMPDRRV